VSSLHLNSAYLCRRAALVSSTDTSGRSDKTPVLLYRSRTTCKQGALYFVRCFTLAACASGHNSSGTGYRSGERVFNRLSLLGHLHPLGGCNHLNLQSAFRLYQNYTILASTCQCGIILVWINTNNLPKQFGSRTLIEKLLQLFVHTMVCPLITTLFG